MREQLRKYASVLTCRRWRNSQVNVQEDEDSESTSSVLLENAQTCALYDPVYAAPFTLFYRLSASVLEVQADMLAMQQKLEAVLERIHQQRERNL